MPPFELSEHEFSPRCREIRVAGELDLAVADQLAAALQNASPDCSRVLIGLEDCEFIDSTGIAVIVQAYHQFGETGRRVSVYGANNQVKRILSVTGLTQNGLVFTGKADALASA